MRNTSDPSAHQLRERQVIEHAEGLLDDERLRVETSRGPLQVSALIRAIDKGDRATDLKRDMIAAGSADRALAGEMPQGAWLTVTLAQKRMLMSPKPVGVIRVVCLSPSEPLLAGRGPEPMSAGEVERGLGRAAAAIAEALEEQGKPPAPDDVPVTRVVCSTSGFAPDARALAARHGDQTTILVEPDDAGGWGVVAPPEARSPGELFNPETHAARRQRVRGYLEQHKADLIGAGLSAERVAGRLRLPLNLVEADMKVYGREHAGFVTERIEGRVVLFRKGLDSAPNSSANSVPAAGGWSGASGGANMPFWEKVKGIFRKEESANDKIGRLATERAALSQQRERCYDEIMAVEQKEGDLTREFAAATASSQRRIATEISQLRKDIERRHQILGAIDKKINIVNTGIHTLELEKQVDPAKLKGLESIAMSSENVEAGLAALQQLDEEANAVTTDGGDMSEGAQAVLDELRAKSAPRVDEEEAEPGRPERLPRTAERPAADKPVAVRMPEAKGEAKVEAKPADRRRSEPEPG